MFKKILVPTDGSSLARHAAQAAVNLAHDLHAGIVGFEATPKYVMHAMDDSIYAPGLLSEAEFDASVAKYAAKHLGEIEHMARAAGVPFTGVTTPSEQTAAAIVEAAKTNACDLIFIGSHGRGNISQIFLGGVTTKVLSLTTLPVLVHRSEK
jgi:nucleotide-binding universal stress UspA family protein